MIGYVESADKNGDYRKIQITLIHTDDFELEKYASERDVYTADRFSGAVQRISSSVQNEWANTDLLKKIINVLKLCEQKQKIAVCVMWKSIGDSGVEYVGFEPINNVWLPTPVTIENCNCMCINVTKLFFTKTPRPLEASFICDILNLLVSYSGVLISNPFYYCTNSVFCDAKFIHILKVLFKKSFLDFEIMKSLNHELSGNKELKKAGKISVSAKTLVLNLSAINIQPTKYDGNSSFYIVGVKRDCIISLIDETVRCLEKGFGLDRFMRHASHHIRKALEKLRSLCTILVAKEHIGRLNDINYLSLYELLEAFAFHEKSMQLKTVVRESAAICRILKNVKIPDYISSDKRLVFI
ncbi:MAG: hypothetical protein II998_06300 [Clostridia bacterium]|nr:hypothetical protein [Clostridia bacterium]